MPDIDDCVQAWPDTDILIENTLISKVGQELTTPPVAQVVDCRNKIISPGLISTQ
jgi:imidazolonepropionase-like amidohydrolase